ncbi:hypothetical protein [Streptomyces sp. NBC_00829]|uniref:hypothetical protein n=1 Tax=Streptomyces sp. NBC_00829 TaxID=2903679 RepID=UPI003863BBE3|nr:hypothetical protein OG293_30245 [Streptomyces sp. NBC_00829]
MTSSTVALAWNAATDNTRLAAYDVYRDAKGLLGGMIWEMSGDTPGGALLAALDSGLR